jgi:hypothetical protein
MLPCGAHNNRGLPSCCTNHLDRRVSESALTLAVEKSRRCWNERHVCTWFESMYVRCRLSWYLDGIRVVLP